jgi:hypothetical protein
LTSFLGDLNCWIVLKGARDYIYGKGGNKLCSVQTLGNIYPEASPAIDVMMPFHPFPEGIINIWHRRLGITMETLRKLSFHGEIDDYHICTQGNLKYSKFSRSTSYGQELLQRFHSDGMGPFIEGYW